MEKHENFTEWACAQGVKINGVAAHRFPGRGLGIVAKRKHEAGSKLVTVPRSALRTAYTVPKSVSEPLEPITVHGLLAADLSLDTTPAREPWRNVLPTSQDFEESMPLMWDTRLQALLPSRAASLLAGQESKLLLDWPTVHKAFPSIKYADYLYAWLLVNTRTFHFTSSNSKIPTPTNPDDCMALNPFADYFNHTDASGCTVDLTSTGYAIIADRVIEEGEEVYISYGCHSNDFLLAEYGFILDENRWDEVSLDSFILPLLSEKHREQLKEIGFLGKYVVDLDDICYRTQVALRVLCLPTRKWQRFLNGFDEGRQELEAVEQTLEKVIQSHLQQVDVHLKRLDSLDCGLPSQRETLKRRWQQIRILLENRKIKL